MKTKTTHKTTHHITNKKNNGVNVYDDIIHLPHHTSHKRPHMSLSDRAAQFSPFSAVVGHEAAVKEVARYTDQRKELDEMEKAIIDGQLREIEAQLPDQCDVVITHFQPDTLKAGGKYLSTTGRVKKIDIYTRAVQMADGTSILIDDIIKIVNVSAQNLSFSS